MSLVDPDGFWPKLPWWLCPWSICPDGGSNDDGSGDDAGYGDDPTSSYYENWGPGPRLHTAYGIQQQDIETMDQWEEMVDQKSSGNRRDFEAIDPVYTLYTDEQFDKYLSQRTALENQLESAIRMSARVDMTGSILVTSAMIEDLDREFSCIIDCGILNLGDMATIIILTRGRGTGLTGGRAAQLAATYSRFKAGFSKSGTPVILDSNLASRGMADALRARGFNVRSVSEIFGKDIGDAGINRLASRIGGRVLTRDRGRQIGEGFGRNAIQVDSRVKSVDEIARILENSL